MPPIHFLVKQNIIFSAQALYITYCFHTKNENHDHKTFWRYVTSLINKQNTRTAKFCPNEICYIFFF